MAYGDYSGPDKLNVERLRELIESAEDELLQWQLAGQLGGQITTDFQHIGNFNDFVWNNRAVILALAEREKRLREITRDGLIRALADQEGRS